MRFHLRGRQVGRVVGLCALLSAVTLGARGGDASAMAARAVAGGVSAALTAPATALSGGVTVALTAPAAALAKATWRITDESPRLFAELDSMRGRSGKLRARQVPRSADRLAELVRVFRDSLLHVPGVHNIRDSTGASRFAVITLRDFAEKLGGRIGGYRIGFWPGESGRAISAAYANPRGFIEVTRLNMHTPVSEHFRLSDFLTHDQQDVWPKYLVLREELVDKLELVVNELEAHGTTVLHMSVMSGFRTPQYNAGGGETGGRAQLSRHMYGDAADVFVDNNRDGRMDDLNGDGRVDHRDAQVILDAAERVERAHADLVGGVGVYRATAAHGPFAHVDVRGNRARWGVL